MLKVSTNALPHLRRVLKGSKSLFFGAKGGGCSGFEYIMKPINISSRSTDEDIVVEGIPFVVCGLHFSLG